MSAHSFLTLTVPAGVEAEENKGGLTLAEFGAGLARLKSKVWITE
jgi:hypothetical protein